MNRWPAILLAGVVAGTIDVGAAALINHVDPGIVLQAIASGVLGKASFSGGQQTMVLGLLLQWMMGMLIAAIFWIGTARIAAAQRHPLIAGALYGLPIYLVMTFMVVPMSRALSKPDLSFRGIAPDLIAMILFAIIVAILPRMISRRRFPM